MAFIKILIKYVRIETPYPDSLLKQIETDDDDDVCTFYNLFNFDGEGKLLLKDIITACKEKDVLFKGSKIKSLLINKGFASKKTNKGTNVYEHYIQRGFQ